MYKTLGQDNTEIFNCVREKLLSYMREKFKLCETKTFKLCERKNLSFVRGETFNPIRPGGGGGSEAWMTKPTADN